MNSKQISYKILLVLFFLQLTTALPTIDPRAEEVKKAFKHAWDGYSKYAYGHDEIQPLSNGVSDSR